MWVSSEPPAPGAMDHRLDQGLTMRMEGRELTANFLARGAVAGRWIATCDAPRAFRAGKGPPVAPRRRQHYTLWAFGRRSPEPAAHPSRLSALREGISIRGPRALASDCGFPGTGAARGRRPGAEPPPVQRGRAPAPRRGPRGTPDIRRDSRPDPRGRAGSDRHAPAARER